MHQAQWSPERPLPPPVSLASQSHHEKPPEVTCTSRGNPGFPASTREIPRETFFNTSRGHSPLPWLGSNDALPLATRTETRLPWRPTRGSLTSPSYLVRNRTLGPLMDALPVTLGDEFSVYAFSMKMGLDKIVQSSLDLEYVALGGTAVGTGANAPAGYKELAIKHLAQLSGFDLKHSKNPFFSLQSKFEVATFSSALRNI